MVAERRRAKRRAKRLEKRIKAGKVAQVEKLRAAGVESFADVPDGRGKRVYAAYVTCGAWRWWAEPRGAESCSAAMCGSDRAVGHGSGACALLLRLRRIRLAWVLCCGRG